MSRLLTGSALLALVLPVVGTPSAQASSGSSSGGSPTTTAPKPVESKDRRATNRIIIKMRDGSTPDVVSLSAQAGETVSLDRHGRDGSWTSKLSGRRSPADVAAITNRIASLPNVAYAEPDLKMFASAAPTDPSYPSQWDLFTSTTSTNGLNLTAARAMTTGTSNVVVAVVDTGITSHIDLAGQVLPGYDMVSDLTAANDGDLRDSNPSDPGDWVTAAENANGLLAGCGESTSTWHGTHVSGTIAAKSDNGIGIAGIAPGTKILPVRVLGKCGGFESDVADGIRWSAGLAVAGVPANPNPAAVISLSLGGAGACPAAYQSAIADAIAVGSLVVVAAGNANSDAATSTPANCAGVVSVAASGPTGSRSWYSNFGTSITIAAQGGDDRMSASGALAAAGDKSGEILSTMNAGTTTPSTDTYAFYEGTSMATPHVSAVAALVKSLQPSITPVSLAQLLRQTASAFPLTSTCTTALCGAGILNAAAAVSAATVTPTTIGAFTKTAPANGAADTATALTLQWSPSVGATGYEYCLVPGLTTPCTAWTSTGAATSVAVSGLLSGTIYSWQVRGVAATTSAEANVSIRSSFTTAIPVGAFGKSAPSNGSSGLGLTTVLSWLPSTGATSYLYCIDQTVNNACDGTWVTAGAVTSVVVGALTGGVTYEWQVKTTANTANAGAAWSFTTAPPVKPLAFGKTAPATAATGLPSTLAVSWQTSGGAASYDSCFDTVVNNVCDTTWVSNGALTTLKPAGLSSGTTYEWQVRSVSPVGTTVANADAAWTFTTTGTTPVASAPSAPTISAATRSASGAVTVTFTAPVATGGSAITDYTLEYSTTPAFAAGTGTIFAHTASPAPAQTVGGLINGTPYFFHVRAINAAGTGAWSAISTSATPYGVPGAPTTVTVAAGSSQATISWAAPASNGGNTISDYRVTVFDSLGGTPTGVTGGTSRLVGSATPTLIFTGLTSAVGYTFKVEAVNAAGFSPSSALSAVVTPGATPPTTTPPTTTPVASAPSAPTISAATRSASGAVTVTFTAPVATGGSAITDYTLEYSTTPAFAAGTGTIFAHTASPAPAQTVGGLINGTPYFFHVRAINAAGTGAWSAISTSATPYGVPGAPTTVTVAAGSSQATISWAAPASNGGNTISDYRVTVFDSLGGTPTGVTGGTSRLVGSATPTLIFTGLTSAVGYTFKVEAVNAAGFSPSSALSAAVTPTTTTALPGAFAKTAPALNATGLSTKPSLSWQASTTATSYQYCFDTTNDSVCNSTWVSTRTARSVTLSGLISKTKYYWQVRAVNTGGTTLSNTGTWWAFTTI